MRIILFFIDIEEIRTILGVNNITFNKNKYMVEDYLNGDDLSENLYSCSLNHYLIQQKKEERPAMRYGHSTGTIDGQHHPQICLAYQVVMNSMELITPEACNDWSLEEGKALISKNWYSTLRGSIGWGNYIRYLFKEGGIIDYIQIILRRSEMNVIGLITNVHAYLYPYMFIGLI